MFAPVPRSPLAAPALLSMALLACQSSSAAPDAAPDAFVADARAPDAAAPLPDLTVNLERAHVDLALREHRFQADACELDPTEACVGEPGDRRLLHFSVETPNVGTADMFLGAPELDNPQFTWSDCHEHFHFEGYAEYRLFDATSRQVAAGRKQAFCLLDSERYIDDPSVAEQPRYGCDFQGIQHGWSDVYHSRLPCQFIDVTDVPDGTYSLQIRVNNGGTLPELSLANNVVALDVELGGADVATPTEPCPEGYSTHATDGLNRECGWDAAGTFDCAPGEDVHVACSQGCELGACTGDAMLRVCDASRADGNCSYPAAIGFDDDSCQTQCPTAAFTRCPDSGKLAVFTAPFSIGEAYSCTVAVEPAAGSGGG
jgi:hypothetical protein